MEKASSLSSSIFDFLTCCCCSACLLPPYFLLSLQPCLRPFFFFFFLMTRPPPRSTLFPYTPLSRSNPPPHGTQFVVIFPRHARSYARFKRHAADRAAARSVAHDLRMHRAGVFHALSFEGHAAGRTRSRLALPHFGAHGANISDRAFPFGCILLRLSPRPLPQLHQPLA